MLALLDVVTDMFFAPTRGIDKASQLSLKKVLVFNFIFILLTFSTTVEIAQSAFGDIGLLMLFICEFFASLAVFFIFALLINGLCDVLFSKNVRVREIFSAFIFCRMPFALSPVLFLLLGSGNGFSLVQTVLAIWSFLLFVLAIKRFYGFGVFKVFLALSLPVIFIIFCIILFFVFVTTVLGSFLSQF